jgi:eukaryotic-like serine/threonine-protein kinase
MTDNTGQQLGHYRLLRLLGHGGFASVYLGEHIHLGTQAAIKVLDTRLSSEEIEVFRNEARTIARLEHPHIVRVLDFGTEDRVPYLVMSYAPNGSLRQHYPKGARLAAAKILPYVKQIAEALQYAHQEKLIHRDVKPENMLLGRNHEVLLSDFGLAIVAYSSSNQGPRDAAGTIAYMAPEQARGKPRPASDQYALAVTAYEWLCGVRPFDGSYEEVAIQHVLRPPPPLRERVPLLSAAIEEVVLKALAKDPQQRFVSVRAFADAFEQACLSEQPITETLASTSSLKALTTTPQQENTTFAIERASASAVYAVAWSPDRRRIAVGRRDRTVKIWDATTGASGLTYLGHAGGVTAVAWSPDGHFIASASLDKTAQVWNAITGHKVASYSNHAGMVYAIAWSPHVPSASPESGSRIASTSGGGSDTSVHVWDASSGHTVLTYRHAYWVRAIAWSPDGNAIASGSWHEVQVWESGTGRKLCTYRGHEGWVRAVAWSPDGKHLASTSEDKTVQVWEPIKGRLVASFRGHADWVRIVVWSPDGKRIASVSRDNVMQIWDAATGNTILTYHGHATALDAIMWLPDGRHVAAASGEGAIQVWQAV